MWRFLNRLKIFYVWFFTHIDFWNFDFFIWWHDLWLLFTEGCYLSFNSCFPFSVFLFDLNLVQFRRSNKFHDCLLIIPIFLRWWIVDRWILNYNRYICKIKLFICFEACFNNLLLFWSKMSNLRFEFKFSFLNKWLLNVEFQIFLWSIDDFKCHHSRHSDDRISEFQFSFNW